VNIPEHRKAIDKLDAQLVKLLNERTKHVLAIGEIKLKAGEEIYAPHRERAVLHRLCKINEGPMTDESLRAVYREIMSSALALEKTMIIAYFGPEATFTHQAAIRRFGSSLNYAAQKTIGDVFTEVSKRRADYGVVPVENSTEGVVSHTLDMFMESSLKITAEILLEVHHDLLSRTGRMEDVRKVYSHPQPLAQCRQWLDENLPGIPVVDVASTAAAAQIVSDDYTAAAIASELAGSLYDLKTVRSRIEDQVNNFTRFLVVSRTPTERSGNDKTSVMFSVKDEPGILCRMLEPFARRGINLSKIESRPYKKKAWEYIFFLDLFGHASDPDVAVALEELKECCQFLKILGSYPRSM